MLLESDIFIAYLKRGDWLKERAAAIIEAVEGGRLGQVQASTEVFHELYYVFVDYAPIEVLMVNLARLATIRNLIYVTPDYSTYLTALSLMDTYGMTSIFDAIYAATALSLNVPDHTIISTDKKYDAIKGIKRIDPQKLEI
ncbi:MAG: PIN domain-containing protein [Candidatus Bathyarchaeia archaeon]|nr:type II toxin-antitoxin system VapC family toxin [Candidatus Bathyarchaeota archaeon]